MNTPYPSYPQYPEHPQQQLPHRSQTLKMWAIILLVMGHALGIIGAITLVAGIGLCIIPFAVIAEFAGFICLCLI